MKKILMITALIFSFTMISCAKEEGQKKRRGIDFDALKTELTLNEEQEKKFDAITADIQKAIEESRESSMGEDGKLNRVKFFTDMETIYNKHAELAAEILDENQIDIYKDYMDKNQRKRPRYNDALLEQIKTELNLDETQFLTVNAANNAFETEFQNAHDIYHGNSDLAKEYWEKFDTQRRNAIESVLSEEQIEKFRELVKDVKHSTRR